MTARMKGYLLLRLLRGSTAAPRAPYAMPPTAAPRAPYAGPPTAAPRGGHLDPKQMAAISS